MHGDEQGADGGEEVAPGKPFDPSPGQLPEADQGQPYSRQAPAVDPLPPENETEERNEQDKEVVEKAGPRDRGAGEPQDKGEVGGPQGKPDHHPLPEDLPVEAGEPAQ